MKDGIVPVNRLRFARLFLAHKGQSGAKKKLERKKSWEAVDEQSTYTYSSFVLAVRDGIVPVSS